MEEIITKVYYIENSDLLDEKIALLDKPEFCLGCSREFIEMDYSEIRVECLARQVEGVEAVLAPCM